MHEHRRPTRPARLPVAEWRAATRIARAMGVPTAVVIGEAVRRFAALPVDERVITQRKERA